MSQQTFLGGARFLTQSEMSSMGANLGPLAQLIGTWKNAPDPPGGIAQGWNVISVPGPNTGLMDSFVFEVIPYTETLTFSPTVIQAANKGPYLNKDTELVQEIFGLKK